MAYLNLNSHFQKNKESFSSRGNFFRNEFNQAALRFLLSFIAIFLTFISYKNRPELFSYLVFPFLFLLHSVVAVSISIVLFKRWKKSKLSPEEERIQKKAQYPRYWIHMLIDQLITTGCLYTVEAPVIIFLAAYALWPLDYGLRFGRKFFYPCTALSVLGMIFLIFFSPYWASFKIVQIGLILNIVFASIYGGKFLSRMIDENKKLSILASKDPLTGILNRRTFLNSAGYFIDSCRKNNVSLACLFIDLDGFKEVNDSHGHATGDALLIKTAQNLSNLMSTQDLVSRLGGDEFAVMVQFNDLKEIIHLCERIKNNISNIHEANSQSVQISASIGVAIYDKNTQMFFNEYDLLRYADNAMYCVKKNGKAQIYACRPGEEAVELSSFISSQPNSISVH